MSWEIRRGFHTWASGSLGLVAVQKSMAICSCSQTMVIRASGVSPEERWVNGLIRCRIGKSSHPLFHANTSDNRGGAQGLRVALRLARARILRNNGGRQRGEGERRVRGGYLEKLHGGGGGETYRHDKCRFTLLSDTIRY